MGQFSSFCVLGVNNEDNYTGGGGGGAVLGLIFARCVPLASQSPYPIIGYSVANYRLFFRLNEEHFTFISSTNILVRLLTVNIKNSLTQELAPDLPQKYPKMCDPILVTLLKMRPHYSQSSHENATPLASYKAVPSLPSPRAIIRLN